MSTEPPPNLDVDLPLPEGLYVTTARPYRVLYLADLAGGDSGTLAGPLMDAVVDLKPDDFADFMAATRPTLTLRLADPVAGDQHLVELRLAFGNVRDFHPAAVFAQLEPAAPLWQARERIVGRLGGTGSAAELTTALAQLAAAQPTLAWLPDAARWTPAAPATPVAPDVVEDVLRQVDLGDVAAPGPGRPNSPITAAVAAAAGAAPGGVSAAETAALRRALGEIDRRATAWLNAVLHLPAFQTLESAWRSLGFLLARMDFRRGLRLSVLHARRDDLTGRLVHLVIDPVFDAGADAPDVILLDRSFGNSAADMTQLDELAQHAASLPAVLLTNVSADFFGVKHAWQVSTLPALISYFDQWQFAKWKALRAQPYARSLAAYFGRGLLREPWRKPSPAADMDSDGIPPQAAAAAPAPAASPSFVYHEECLGEAHCLWTGGALAATCNIVAAVAEHGWPTQVFGRLEGFAVGSGGPKGAKPVGPADTSMPIDKAQELAAGGLNAVVGVPKQSAVVVCNGLSAARPARLDDRGLLEVSLPYQLFAGRISSLLLELKPRLIGQPDREVTASVLAHVRAWLGVSSPTADEQQIAVQLRPVEGEPGVRQLALIVAPPPHILPGGIPVVVGYRLT